MAAFRAGLFAALAGAFLAAEPVGVPSVTVTASTTERAAALVAFGVAFADFATVGGAAFAVVLVAGPLAAAFLAGVFLAGAFLAGVVVAAVADVVALAGEALAARTGSVSGLSVLVAVCAGMALLAAFRTASARSAMAFPHT